MSDKWSKLEREFLILGFGTAQQQVDALESLIREQKEQQQSSRTEESDSSTRGGSTAATRTSNRANITAHPPPPEVLHEEEDPPAEQQERRTRRWADATTNVGLRAKQLSPIEQTRQYNDVQEFAFKKAKELMERRNVSMPDDPQVRGREQHQPSYGIIRGITKEEVCEYLVQVRNRIAGWYYPQKYRMKGRDTVARRCQLSALVNKVFDNCDFGYLLRGDLSGTKRDLESVFQDNGQQTHHFEWNPNSQLYGWAFQLRECLENFIVRN